MSNGQLDEYDIKILNILQQDARISATKLGTLINKTEFAVRQRLLKLCEQGYIKQFIAIVDRDKVGKPVQVVLHVKLIKSTKAMLDDFKKLTDSLDEVQFCLHVSGKWNFLLHVTAETPKLYYEWLMTRICDLPNVADVETSFVLNECKSFSPFKL